MLSFDFIYNDATNRGYLIFSVYDRFLFHQMNTKSCIFTSSEATREYTAFDVHEYTGKINFSVCFLFCFFMLKFDFFFYFSPSDVTTEKSLRVNFVVFNVFTGYIIN